jgi:GABA(A) receptor-associated protein
MLKFRDKPAHERKHAIQMIFRKYPDRIPVYVSKEDYNKPGNITTSLLSYTKKSDNIPTIDKDRFLVPGDLTVGQFLYVIRQRIKLKPEQALYIYFNNMLMNTNMTIKEVYMQHKNEEDDMLYCVYNTENTFG